MTTWIAVMYICILQQCEFLQQQTVYTDRQLCKAAIEAKVEWYRRNAHAQAEGDCMNTFMVYTKP